MQYGESDDNDDAVDDAVDDADDYRCGPLLFLLYRRSELEMYRYETVPSSTPNSWALSFLTSPLSVSSPFSNVSTVTGIDLEVLSKPTVL